MTSDLTADDGFPYRSYPTGWFQVAWLGEVPPGEIVPRRYFGRDMVVVRTEDDEVQVLDAHCAHMGAHLGYGGCLKDGSIVCPFHGWEWDLDGGGAFVPADGRRTERRKIRPWTTHVSNEIVWVWHDALGREPLWPAPADLPGMAEGERYPLHPHCVGKSADVVARPQYVTENAVDLEHLHWVHRAQGPIDWKGFEADGYCFRTKYQMIWGYGKDSTWLTPDGPRAGIIDGEAWGIGYMYTFFHEPDHTISIQAQTPIDERHSDLFQSVLVYREEGDDGDEPQGFAARRVREQVTQVERDLPIWAHLHYEANPPLMRSEAKPVAALRRWAAQFYPADEPASVGS